MKINRKLVQELLGEFTGTAMLVTIGCLVCISHPLYPKDINTFAWGWAFTVALCVHTFAYMSGAHINPWVTLCATILGNMEIVKMLLYFLMQFLGAFTGAILVIAIKPKELSGMNICLTTPHPRIEAWQAVCIEYLATSTLLFSCCGAWDKRSKGQFDSISLRIGLVVGGLVLMCGDYTGASLNIARTIAPHVIQGHFKTLWIYLVGQLLAAVLTPLIWRFVLTGKQQRDEE